MPYASPENSDKNTLPYLGKELVISSLLGVLALLLVGHLHVVEAIKRPDAQKLTPKEHNITTRIEKDRISEPISLRFYLIRVLLVAELRAPGRRRRVRCHHDRAAAPPHG